MNSRRMEFSIGIMVIGIVIAVFIMTVLFQSENHFIGGGGGPHMTIKFSDGTGISANSLVLKNGIKIGRVASVVLHDKPDESYVEVEIELKPEAKIYSNEVAKINRTFLGDASIEIVDDPNFDKSKARVEREAGDILESSKSSDFVSSFSNIEGDLGLALQNVNQASEGITLFMKNLNDFIGDEDELQQKKERLQGVFTELNETLVSIRSLASHMDEVVTDAELKENITEATQKIPSIMKRVDEIAGKADIFMDKANEATTELKKTLARSDRTFELVDKNLDNINVFTTSLADNGPEMMTALNEGSVEIKGAIDEVKGAIENIARLANSLNDQLENHDTPLGMLTDKDAGAELRRIVENAEELTEKLYPILDDARVFSNKIAHKPSSLLWDKNQTKGGVLSGKFGWQSKSPNGGVSSPLYRQTPSGAKICDRSYYEPMANVDYMDARTRVAYENETVNRRFEQGVNLANAEFDLEARHFAEGYSDVLPTTSPLPSNLRSNLPATRIGARMKARTSRIRWSLASFWNRFSPKRRAAENAEPVALAQTGSWNGVELAGFEGDPTLGGAIEQTGYWQGDFAAPYGEFAPGTDNCGVPACAPQTCAPQTCDAPNCAAPGCDGAASNGGTTGGEGYRPQTVGAYPAKRQENASGFGSLGAYRGAEPKPLDFELSGDDAEQIEELPSSIMRPLSSAGSYSPSASTGSAFEDDGVPMQFVPPSRF